MKKNKKTQNQHQKIQIIEVGPRDGLQNESTLLSLEAKLQYINALYRAGLQRIEVGSMVRPDKVPQMASSELVFAHLPPQIQKRAIVLVPNERGLDRAHSAGANNISLLSGVTDTFVERNSGMTVAQSLQTVKKLGHAHPPGWACVRVYLSVTLGCPYTGKVSPASVTRVVNKLLDMGAQDIVISDTIGVATPESVARLLDSLLKVAEADFFTLHLHDTWGMGCASLVRAVDMGIRRVDSSSGGLGGCPYAPGASGNIPTEDVVYLLESLGFKTGVDLVDLSRASRFILDQLKKEIPPSKTLQALEARTSQKSCYPPVRLK